MRYTCTSIVAMLVLAGTVHAQPVQWTVAEGGNGHWYKYNPTPTDWHSARSYASQQGGDLASISSVEENVFIHNLVPHAAWIGATDEAEEGDWHWSNSDTWDYTNWGSGEPNNNDPTYGEDYAYMVGYDHPNGTDFWYDGSIITADIASVIEWDHNPNIAQWRIEDGGNGHWYKPVDTNADCFGDIRMVALSLGGDLADIESEEENQFITGLLIPGVDYWIGLIQNTESPDYSEPDGGWEWINGTALTYENWDSDEPNNAGAGEESGGIAYDGSWYDLESCDFGPEPQFAVIEWSSPPTLGGCCVNSGCYPTTEIACSHLGGTWLGVANTCESCPDPCLGDTDGNGVVDIEDMLNVIGGWGPCP